MTPTLRNYILRNIGPSALRLELVNRLENLCTLTGTPMSPELHRWVEDTFGLEMVRILEGYSSLTAPVISPQLQERINRIVPNNYQGENVNLMFKQLFDVSCVPPLINCLYLGFIDFSSIPALDLFFDAAYTQPLFTNSLGAGQLRTLMQSNGGEVYGLIYDGSSFVFEGCHCFYYGTSANNIDVYSATLGGYYGTISFAPISSSFVPCDATTCYTATYNNTSTILSMLNYITPAINLNSISLFINPPIGADIFLSDVNTMTLLFKQQYGQSAVYSYVDNGNGTSTITLDKAIDWMNNGSSIQLGISDAFGYLTYISFDPC